MLTTNSLLKLYKHKGRKPETRWTKPLILSRKWFWWTKNSWCHTWSGSESRKHFICCLQWWWTEKKRCGCTHWFILTQTVTRDHHGQEREANTGPNTTASLIHPHTSTAPSPSLWLWPRPLSSDTRTTCDRKRDGRPARVAPPRTPRYHPPVRHHFIKKTKNNKKERKKKGAREDVGRSSFADPLHHPVLLAQRAAVVLLHPQRHAAVVEGVVAFSPNHWRHRGTRVRQRETRRPSG